jgi:hypothetical protein
MGKHADLLRTSEKYRLLIGSQTLTLVQEAGD